jgi:hypothetical protein
MKRIALLAAVAAALMAAAPAQANHLYLGPDQAGRLVGKALNMEYDNVAQGSLDATCPKVPGRRDYRVCGYTYWDDADNCYEGVMAIRLATPTWFRYRIWEDKRCHGYA